MLAHEVLTCTHMPRTPDDRPQTKHAGCNLSAGRSLQLQTYISSASHGYIIELLRSLQVMSSQARRAPGQDDVGNKHGREAAEADGQHACSIVVRAAGLITEHAGELGGLAQDQRIGGDERQHDGVQVLRAPAKAEQECYRHHNQLRDTYVVYVSSIH
jgi:hypothetical protein